MTTSVALCSYNGGRYIAEQLDSILQQTVPVDEIVVCDDGSTDNTAEILKSFERKHPGKFRIYLNGQQLGVIKNFEKAINLCRGEIVFLSDQDDIWLPHKVETVLEYFSQNPEMKSVLHDMKFYSTERAVSRSTFYTLNLNPESVQKLPAYKQVFYIGPIVTGAAFAFRKQRDEEFSFIGGNRLFLHDAQLANHFARKQSLGLIFEPLAFYRLHSEQVMGYKNTDNAHRIGLLEQATSENPKTRLKYLADKYQRSYEGFSTSEALKKEFEEDILHTYDAFLAETNKVARPFINLLWKLSTRKDDASKFNIVKYF